MAAPIALRGDFDGPGLRRLAKQSKDAAQARRFLALAEIYDGGSRTDAARIGGVTLQIVRDQATAKISLGMLILCSVQTCMGRLVSSPQR